jgi:protoheme IX farnesyltransferase
VSQTIRDYASLTKPRINALLLLTMLAGMVMAKRGWPGTQLVILTVTGGGLTAAGAAALNCWFDRDLDRVMVRTRNRPLPAGRIPPSQALLFAVLLGVAGLLLLGRGVNELAALLAGFGLFYYVVVYTLWLKRATPANIVIGGAAGAVPPLVGWGAVTGRLTLPALYLFAIIFCWTPPHFWALGLRLRGDYTRAGIPMLPVVAGDQETKRQILCYVLLLFALTLLPFVTRTAGVLYLAAATILGLGFIVMAVANLRDGRRWLRPLFDYSLAYLALLFAAMALDGAL